MIYNHPSRLIAPVKAAFDRGIVKLKAKGIAYEVTETLRMWETQVAYFLQGRSTIGGVLSVKPVNVARKRAGLPPITDAGNKIITDTLESYHLEGKAFDIVPLGPKGERWYAAPKETWFAIAECFESEGFTWGGRWKPGPNGLGWDCPHFEKRA